MTTPPDRVIDTARLRLRPMTEDDVDDLVTEISDFSVAEMLARVPHPYRRSDALAVLESSAVNAGRDLALVITDGDRAIGGIGLTGIRSEREFGYWLGRAHWGKGFATEAGMAFLAHVFAAFDIDVVRSGVFFDNPRSLRTQEKLGFERIGSRPVHCLARGAKVAHIDTILTRARFMDIRS